MAKGRISLVAHYCTLFERVKIKTPYGLDWHEDELETKPCEQCSKEFTPRATNDKYCSKKCRLKKYERICPCCKNGFIPNRIGMKQGFCSKSCALKHRHANKKHD